MVARVAHRAGLKDDKQPCETWWQHNGQQVSVGTLPCDKFYIAECSRIILSTRLPEEEVDTVLHAWFLGFKNFCHSRRAGEKSKCNSTLNDHIITKRWFSPNCCILAVTRNPCSILKSLPAHQRLQFIENHHMRASTHTRTQEIVCFVIVARHIP